MSIGACYSHYHSLLVLAKWSIVKCRSTRWLLVNLCCFPCKDEGDLFWRCFKLPPYPCSMPSNPKRCMSLTAFYFLKNSGDMVLQHFATFRTRLWPTKMPTRMVFSHSKLCDLVRGRKVGCSSLIAKKHGVSVRAANKLWKPRIDRLLQQVGSLVSIHINMIWETTCDPAMSIEPFAEQVQRQLPRAPPDKKGKRRDVAGWCEPLTGLSRSLYLFTLFDSLKRSGYINAASD